MTGTTPLGSLGVIGRQERRIDGAAGGLVHHELFTLQGLVTILWHGDPTSPGVVIACGGAMGGLLGPSGGLYQELGVALAAQGVQTLRVSYRQPNDLGRCVHDVAAVAELACRKGGQHVVVLGHSFGGAVAIQTAAALPQVVTGVVTFATQSAGCEVAGQIDPAVDLLLFHGDRDELLPVECSLVVKEIAGRGDVVILPGAGHLMTGEGPRLLDHLLDWLPPRLGSP